MDTTLPSRPKNKGGRPKKAASQKRSFQHCVYLSEVEQKHLARMMEQTGQSAADLFRHALFGKGLRIPKARLAPEELMEILSDFKKKSSLITLLSHRERDFTEQEKQVLIGSSASMRSAVERLQRSVFESLDRADELEEMTRLGEVFKQVLEGTKGRQGFERADWQTMEKLLQRLVRLLEEHYQFLSLSQAKTST